MLLGETIAVAFQSIRANKLRAVLTMLGIIIGVGAVITMVALGSGAQKAVEDRIAALGANVLTVFAGQGRLILHRDVDSSRYTPEQQAEFVRQDNHLYTRASTGN